MRDHFFRILLFSFAISDSLSYFFSTPDNTNNRDRRVKCTDEEGRLMTFASS
jgi:hypothetical protein